MSRAATLTGARVVLRPDWHTAATAALAVPGMWCVWTITVRGTAIGRTQLRQYPDDPEWADFSIEIDQPRRRGRGYGSEATRLVLDYAFTGLLVAVVQLTVAAGNRRALACYRKCGFVAYTMGRVAGQSSYGMVCLHPAVDHIPMLDAVRPALVLIDPPSRRLTLRPVECAFLGVGPGAQVAVEVDADGAAVITPAEVAA